VPGISAIGHNRMGENVEASDSDQEDGDWEAEMERRDVVTDQLFGLQISTPARAGGTSPCCWSGSPANQLRRTPVPEQSPPYAVDSSPSVWSTSTVNSELAVAGPQVLFSF